MDFVLVKYETIEEENPILMSKEPCPLPPSSDSCSSSDSSEDDSHDEITSTGKRTRSSDDGCNGDSNKKQKAQFILPLGFLDPLPQPLLLPPPHHSSSSSSTLVVSRPGSKQFWKAGDYDDEASLSVNNYSSVGMDHVRVHPKFLHSNATSHKWALGAMAELLDNALDEVCYGATFVSIDVLENTKDMNGKMLVIEDDGGGMDPDRMRQCMSLGYSAKSKLANVIGQYGNGFKTSTMRLGADVIVFSRCCRGRKAPTQSIGLLSYTFLKSTGKEDIVVPMLDFEKGEHGWKRLIRSSRDDWTRNAETVVHWSPYSSEAELFDQFSLLGDHGTRIVIYNLWEDDQGELELDFTDPHDIQIRDANRDESKIKMAAQFPNSRHFLTYHHSLRSYAAILYLRLPPGFRIVLRGKEIEHHNVVEDMMLVQRHTYKPTQAVAGGALKDPNMLALVTIGFVKDAKDHIDVQGFNVYHKNRLIKPFWRVWNAAGSDGRGVIGVLEANFVEPAHDKQGFERTTVLQRLEQRLLAMQKSYWRSQCHEIGYAPRQRVKLVNASTMRQTAPEDAFPDQSTPPSGQNTFPQNTQSFAPPSTQTALQQNAPSHLPQSSAPPLAHTSLQKYAPPLLSQSSAPPLDQAPLQQYAPPPLYNNYEVKLEHSYDEQVPITLNQLTKVVGNGDNVYASETNLSYLNHFKDIENRRLKDTIKTMKEKICALEAQLGTKAQAEHSSSGSSDLIQLTTENRKLKECLKRMHDALLRSLNVEKERSSSLEVQLNESKLKMEQMNKEQEKLIKLRDNEETNLRKRLKYASDLIQFLLNKYQENLESISNIKQET